MKCTIVICALLLCGICVKAQQSAQDKIVAGAALVDEGKYDEALKLLREGAAMEPGNYHWAYEVAFAYYRKGDYPTATREYERVMAMPGADAQCYAMLGNCYDYTKDTAAAWRTYEAGLKKFPNSGHLLVEMGHMQRVRENYGKALGYYEASIRRDPGFATSYYWAAFLYLHSTNKVWGMMYGEAFMNLERNSERTAGMSKMLYDAYRSSIKRSSDTSVKVTFEKNTTLDVSEITDKKGDIHLPFAMKVYEPLMLMAALFNAQTLDMDHLADTRKQFLKLYYEQHVDKEYPDLLLAYQKKVTDAGHADAYHHWILMKGDEEAFRVWKAAHQPEWEDFIKWFGDNKLVLDERHVLLRN